MGKLQQKQRSRIWLKKRFSCVHEKFLRVTYVQNCTHICRKNRIIWEAQCQLRFQWLRHRKKTVTVFGISRASVSTIIKKVFYAIKTFSGSQPIELPTTENKVKEFTNKLLGIHEFPQSIRAIHDTHTEIVELNITEII